MHGVTLVTADGISALALFFAYPTAVWRTRSQLEGVSVADGYGCF